MNTFSEVKGNLIIIVPVDAEYMGKKENESDLPGLLLLTIQSKIGRCELLSHELKFTRLE